MATAGLKCMSNKVVKVGDIVTARFKDALLQKVDGKFKLHTIGDDFVYLVKNKTITSVSLRSVIDHN